MADYRDISDRYTRQFPRPDDARREAEEAERKASLAEYEPEPPEESALALYNQAWDREVAKHAIESATEAGGRRVDDAIGEAVRAAEQRVEAAGQTTEQRQARAFVDELERRGTVLGDTHFHGYDETEATPEETAALEAELADEDLALLDAENEWEASGHGY